MTARDIIGRKRDGHKLTRDEIDYFVRGYVKGRIPDYQMAALLMAICLRGMDTQETACLTEIMLHSGEVLNFADVPGPKVDKHSTGGVGDKVSLVLAPLVAAAGVKVPMISGRGLGHTGGTLDKLEAIPGFRTDLEPEALAEQLQEVGLFIAGQTARLVPADRRMYALRDATATVDSIPLVTASILSKKLAEGIDGLVLDVKTGGGAFFQEQEQAEALARSLVSTAQEHGLPTVALLTSMEQPLGHMVGTWLETKEAILCLRGQGAEDVMEVTFALGAVMLLLAGRCSSRHEADATLRQVLASGAAYERFVHMVEAQGGDLAVVDNPDSYPPPRCEGEVHSLREGFVSAIDARAVGTAVCLLGGGRQVVEDAIDYSAGVVSHKKVGERVHVGDVLASLYCNKGPMLDEAARMVRDAFRIFAEPVSPPPLIQALIDEHGTHPWPELSLARAHEGEER
ncbi:MAG: thymidine phosphorylase [bacterium]|jgi:pyrimidine-nucleoside phosphorylase|nr:thymidine phosphorylase [candidate division KSB1 bacterium]MDH7558926.1 thymidine phosphorylase [bacterium]